MLRPITDEPGKFIDTNTGIEYTISDMKEDYRYDFLRWTWWNSFEGWLWHYFVRRPQEIYCRVVGGSASVTVWDARMSRMPWWLAAWTCRRKGHLLRVYDAWDPGDPEDVPFTAWCARCLHFEADTMLPKSLDSPLPPE